MAYKIEDTIALRKELEHLDLTNPSALGIYRAKRLKYMKIGEDESKIAYKDINGYVTIGIGFNMDRKGAKQEWQEAFTNYKDAPNFQEVYDQKRLLTENEIKILFNYSLAIREKELRNIYDSILYRLTANELLAIEDAYYNAPSIVRRGTNFYTQIKAYDEAKQAGDLEKAELHWRVALCELKHYSNPQNIRGLQNRRDSQAAMLNTHDHPIFRTIEEAKQELKQLEKQRAKSTNATKPTTKPH